MGLDQVRRDWTRLGAADPLWAVLVRDSGRHDGWDPAEFLSTGRSELAAVMSWVESCGIRPGSATALDFGCGAGRLTQALTAYADDVVGVDISPTMLRTARDLDPAGSCTFVLNDRPDLSLFSDGSFDIVYTALVLQHLPAELATGYLTELVRVLRPGGVLVAQVATRPDRSPKGRLAGLAPRAVLRFAQRQVLRYPAPMDMYPLSADTVHSTVLAPGGHVVAAREEPMYGGHWVYDRYLVTRE